MELLTGTSGFAYDAWRGPFYPEDLPARERLRFYAGRLPAVELNNTFYRMPRRSVVESWAAAVPEDFRFAVKASRRITHHKRLRDVGEEVAYLRSVLEPLGPRLGAVLFQLPPTLRADPERLDAFLALLPEGFPAALEPRHPSWDEPALRERLAARGVAQVVADTDEAPVEALVRTADWGYLRLRRGDYDDAALDAWAARLGASGWGRAFAFFKHEDAGAAPALARGLRERMEGAARAPLRPARPADPRRRRA